VVTDEVYQHMTYDVQHIPLATLPGMADRTLTISSAGKTFSFTGWKVGWAVGPADLVTAVRTAKQFLTFVSGAPFQPAIALGLGLPDSYFTRLRDSLRAKRDRLCRGLREVGFEVFEPAGTYFVTADVRPLGYTDGVEFCRDLPQRCGVVAIPHQVFYDDIEAGKPLVRFAFCKRDEVLDDAVERLQKLRS
jgi:N-succinyldiaminopimelate aminotransferase